MLASFYITYKDFAASMAVMSGLLSYDDPRWQDSSFNGRWVAFNFKEGYQRAASIAKKNNFERFFAIEPTASISYNSKDINGYTVTPEISPPVCHPETKVVRRQNDEGFEEFQYPPNVEVAEKDVDWQTYDLLCASFQKMQANTGLGHGTNYNWWLCKPLTDETFDDWFKSPLLSIYYRWNTAFGVEDKTNIGVDVTEESEEFWGLDAFDEDEEDEEDEEYYNKSEEDEEYYNKSEEDEEDEEFWGGLNETGNRNSGDKFVKNDLYWLTNSKSVSSTCSTQDQNSDGGGCSSCS
jgi:hypothetical protein